MYYFAVSFPDLGILLPSSSTIAFSCLFCTLGTRFPFSLPLVLLLLLYLSFTSDALYFNYFFFFCFCFPLFLYFQAHLIPHITQLLSRDKFPFMVLLCFGAIILVFSILYKYYYLSSCCLLSFL